ncbi:MAG: bifunctional UDP-N-acetylglucosamine diphosphorylase/glucosamine-1-phosphate N-acetyltransferase GlmU [Candidatus Aminicenantia bacterium]
MPKPFLSIVLSAGQGTRFKSERIKILHKLLDKPMVCLVLECLKKINPEKILVVVGYQKEEVIEELSPYGVEFVWQKEQLGTAHAVMCAEKILKENKEKDLLVLNGDVPLLQPDLLVKLIRHHQKNNFSVTLVTAEIDSPKGYGRIVRNDQGQIVKIVEDKDARPLQKKIKEINAGIYLFKILDLLSALPYVSNKNIKKEYYLPEVVEILAEKDKSIGEIKTDRVEDILGVNTRYELSQAVRILRERKIKALAESGVTFLDPATTWIDLGVKIEPDTVIYSQVIIEKNTRIGKGCSIYPFVHIINSQIGNRVKILSSTMIEESIIEDKAQIGPFTHLRPKTIIKSKAKVGNFVEMKNTIFGKGSKAGHLSYLGDSEVGEGVNIGAGTVTCNFDGFKKYKTLIESGAFIGSGAELVAPIKIGREAYIGAGSTITKDVKPYSLAVARGKQISKLDWVKKRKRKK